MEDKDSYLSRAGVYSDYEKVVAAYLNLYETERRELEPLKRALFLCWYAEVEPPCFTGVGGLSAEVLDRARALLSQACTDLDEEFRWMVRYYLEICDWFFAPPFWESPRWSSVRALDWDAWRMDEDAGSRMRNRGLMGDYWVSILAGSAA